MECACMCLLLTVFHRSLLAELKTMLVNYLHLFPNCAGDKYGKTEQRCCNKCNKIKLYLYFSDSRMQFHSLKPV